MTTPEGYAVCFMLCCLCFLAGHAWGWCLSASRYNEKLKDVDTMLERIRQKEGQ